MMSGQAPMASNMPPNQAQYSHTYVRAPYHSQQLPSNEQQQAYSTTQACYNCGLGDHWAQNCPEPRRQIPAGSLAENPRPPKSKKKKGPIVTRYAPPTGYMNQPQSPTVVYPQSGRYPHQQGQAYPQQAYGQQTPQGGWVQPRGYNGSPQWQQPYGAAAPAQSPTTYGPQQPNAYQGYNQAQAGYPQQPHEAYAAHAAYPQTAQGPHVQQGPYNQAAGYYLAQPQYPEAAAGYNQYPQHATHQYSQTTAQPYPQGPQQQNYGGNPGPNRQFSRQAPQNAVPTPPPSQQSQTLRPPPCFPQIETNTKSSRSLIWRPAPQVDEPLEATFDETEAKRKLKPVPTVGDDALRTTNEPKKISKYFDEKGRRLYGHKIDENSEMMKDPAFKSVRTGGSMLAQPLDYSLPEEEVEAAAKVLEGAGNTNGGEAATVNGHVGQEREDAKRGAQERKMGTNGTSNGEIKGEQISVYTGGHLNGYKGNRAKMTSMAGRKRQRERDDVDGIVGYDGAADTTESGEERTRRNRGIKERRKSGSPSSDSRSNGANHQSYRERANTQSSLAPQPSNHPLPPKPVNVPPPLHGHHDGKWRNQKQNAGFFNNHRAHPRQAQNGQAENRYPSGRRSASPSRQFKQDERRRERDYNNRRMDDQSGVDKKDKRINNVADVYGYAS
ncbi:hypothetical protein RUND412_011087 [Rhizina undulata]